MQGCMYVHIRMRMLACAGVDNGKMGHGGCQGAVAARTVSNIPTMRCTCHVKATLTSRLNTSFSLRSLTCGEPSRKQVLDDSSMRLAGASAMRTAASDLGWNHTSKICILGTCSGQHGENAAGVRSCTGACCFKSRVGVKVNPSLHA